MKTDKRKVALVGCGMVGMSYAYAMLNQNVCDVHHVLQSRML